MEPIIWLSLGASGVVCLILLRLAAAHGWAWVRAQVAQRAALADAAFNAKVAAAAGDLGARLSALEGEIKRLAEGELAAVRADISAIKPKVGL
jgi:hypothetical protein